jgi:ParB family transcriptional regulator, chromosome partitioning protein
MAEGRRGLGRGLSALLGESEAELASTEAREASGALASAAARETPIELLSRNPDQPRRHFNEADIAELADSIREVGIIQPLLVRPVPGSAGDFQIVAGERRWRAAQMAGLKTVPVLVRDLDDLAVLEIGIIENVQRADLNPVEEALGYRALIERFGRTQEAVAQTVGKSRSHVANALRLLSLPDEVQALLLSGALSAGHARAIVSGSDPIGLARQIVEGGLSVRATEALVRKAGAPSAPRASRPGKTSGFKDADTRALESDLSDILGLDVEILDKDGAGEIRISYATLEQLDDLCRRLTRTAAGMGARD